jgi:hypothetical protein
MTEMPIGDLARSDTYDLPDVGDPLVPSGPQVSPGLPAVNRAADVLSRYPGHVMGSLLGTPQALIENSQNALDTGTYDPRGPLGAALMTMGAGGIAGVPVKGAETILGAGAVRRKPVMEPATPGNIPETPPEQISIPVAGPTSQINAPYISNPVRVANPGVYKDPRVIAAEANAKVAPEHPALKELFGVTRQDLYDISQQGRRQGNMQPDLWQPSKPGKINEAAAAVANPANAQRLIDTLAEARKYPGLEQGMVPWYVMDPAYQQMERLVGPERAAKEYQDFNMSMTPFSAGSSVPAEINRGTAANMMRMRGEYPVFQKYGGLAADKRGGADYPEILRDVKGMMGHGNQADPVARYMATGSHGYGTDNVKINLYSGASGVPQTGFQTTGAVPDAHFTRALGVPDARKNPNDFNEYMIGTEYRHIGPWYREQVAKPLGIEAVPAQALMWGTYGPQTGVKTQIGAGKLELLSKQIWERAQKLGIDPRQLRDQVLTGQQHAELEDDNRGMGSLAAQDSYG